MACRSNRCASFFAEQSDRTFAVNSLRKVARRALSRKPNDVGQPDIHVGLSPQGATMATS